VFKMLRMGVFVVCGNRSDVGIRSSTLSLNPCSHERDTQKQQSVKARVNFCVKSIHIVEQYV
jgi:hypothetical protein